MYNELFLVFFFLVLVVDRIISTITGRPTHRHDTLAAIQSDNAKDGVLQPAQKTSNFELRKHNGPSTALDLTGPVRRRMSAVSSPALDSKGVDKQATDSAAIRNQSLIGAGIIATRRADVIQQCANESRATAKEVSNATTTRESQTQTTSTNGATIMADDMVINLDALHSYKLDAMVPNNAKPTKEDSDYCIALFIDDSNVFIEGQKFYAKHFELIAPKDPCFRVDIGILKDILLNGREMSFGILYGSEPPARDTVWATIEKGGMEVKRYRKNFKNKEKEIDNALTADAMNYVCMRYSEGKSGTVIIVAGDRDYRPVVKNIMQMGWNVEMAAFSTSMSSALKTLEESSDLLELKLLDEMFEIEPLWYYCSRKFKSIQPSGQRNLMPRDRTMILEFSKSFDSTRCNSKLLELTDEITKLLRIPCLFKPRGTNECRWLFLIGLTKQPEEEEQAMVSQRRLIESLKGLNITEDKMTEILKKNRCLPVNTGKTNSTDFLEVCKREHEAIAAKCKATVGKLQKLTTINEYFHRIPEPDTIKLENRFACLTLLDDDVENNLIVDDFEVESEDESEDDGKDADTLHHSDEEKPPKSNAVPRKRCSYGFNCDNILRCSRQHSDDEIKFCKLNDANRATSYKSKPCTRFSSRSCIKGKTEIALLCTYYHSSQEARCYICDRHAGVQGHAANNCPCRGMPARPSATSYVDTGSSDETCVYGFTCSDGSTCRKSHTECEKAFFRKNKGKGAPGYKSKPCDHYRKRTCFKGQMERAPMCAFYHSQSEAMCYQCRTGESRRGHLAVNCGHHQVSNFAIGYMTM